MSLTFSKSPSARHFLALLFAAGMIVGCGKPDYRRGMSGNVTLKGEPVTSGSIQFESVVGQTPFFSTGAMIKGGAFVIPPGKSGLPVGTYRVMINSASTPFVAPGPPGSQPVMKTTELVPAAYNTKSEVTVDVTADGANQFNFDIP